MMPIARGVGVISADPDGAGSLKRRAVKTTYNADGQPTVVETGTVNGTSDSDWTAFVTLQQSTASYDTNGRKTKDVITASGTTYSVAQYSYDTVGRLECAALRMNSATWGALPASACTLGTAGSFGNDRITKSIFNAAGQVTKVQTAYGTPDQSDEITETYSNNGQVATVTDEENNKTSYSYDGFDRLSVTYYPSSTKGAGASNGSDYEQLSYDANGNVTQKRLRDGQTIGYIYDNLGRTIARNENGTLTRQYGYNLLGQLTSSAWSGGGSAEILSYDALGRLTSRAEPYTTLSYQYDAAGNRTRLSWPDGLYVAYSYDVLGEMTSVLENGSTTLATYSYDDLGRRTSLARGNGTATYYGYDGASRLTCLTQDLAGGGAPSCSPSASGQDNATVFSYNPAGQIASRSSANDAYAWNGSVNVDRNYTANGLNQYTASGAVSLSYDGRGNLTTSGSTTYGYDALNHLTSTNGSTAFVEYGSLDELQGYNTTSGTYPRYASDGGNIIGEYLWNTNPGLQRRYVYDAGTDEPLVWYEGTGTSDRRWLVADERGSVVAVTNASGAATAINSYDEYGIPGSANAGTFQYTGQAWLPQLGLSYYKARMYSPTLGRFLQTDPIGYADGLNWYNYVGGDPLNSVDPSGLEVCQYENYIDRVDTLWSDGTTTRTYTGFHTDIIGCGGINGSSGSRLGTTGLGGGGGDQGSQPGDIVVTATNFEPQNARPNILMQQGRRNGTGKRGEAGENPNPDKPKTPKPAFGKPGYVVDVDRNGQKGKPRLARPGEPGYGTSSFSDFLAALAITAESAELLLLLLAL